MSQEMVTRKRRNIKLTRKQVAEQLSIIWNQLLMHRGQKAILLQKEGRRTSSYLVTLLSQSWGKGLMAQSTCYTLEGERRCTLSHSIDIVKILTGEQQLIYLNHGL